MSEVASYRRPDGADLTPMQAKQKAKGAPRANAAAKLALARGWVRFLFFRQFLQHRQGLNDGRVAHIGAADIAVFAIMGDHAAAACRGTEIDEANRLARDGARRTGNTRNRN